MREHGEASLSEGFGDHESIYRESPLEVRADAVVAEVGGVAGAPDQVLKRRLGFGFWLAIGWLVTITLLTVFAAFLPLEDPEDVGAGGRLEAPSGEHWLGTDNLGRDVMSRTIYGARISLLVGFSAIAAGLLVGGLFGLVAGFRRGWFERVTMVIADVLLSIPALVLALAIVTFWGRDMWQVVAALAILSIAPIARLSRANTVQWSQREFVLASRALGAKDRSVLFREVLPNVLMPMASLALVGVAIVIVAEATLALLGVGIESGIGTERAISWGKMTVEGKEVLGEAPHMAFVPGAAIFFTVLALNFAGDKLRAHYDVRESLL